MREKVWALVQVRKCFSAALLVLAVVHNFMPLVWGRAICACTMTLKPL